MYFLKLWSKKRDKMRSSSMNSLVASRRISLLMISRLSRLDLEFFRRDRPSAYSSASSSAASSAISPATSSSSKSSTSSSARSPASSPATSSATSSRTSPVTSTAISPSTSSTSWGSGQSIRNTLQRKNSIFRSKRSRIFWFFLL